MCSGTFRPSSGGRPQTQQLKGYSCCAASLLLDCAASPMSCCRPSEPPIGPACCSSVAARDLFVASSTLGHTRAHKCKHSPSLSQGQKYQSRALQHTHTRTQPHQDMSHLPREYKQYITAEMLSCGRLLSAWTLTKDC